MPKEYYSTSDADDAMVIKKENDEFVVYMYEHGKRNLEKHFKTEAEACKYFYNELVP